MTLKVRLLNIEKRYFVGRFIYSYSRLRNPKFQVFNEQKTMENKGRRLFIVRHAERVDFTFGDWISFCFDKSGNYKRSNLNMPESVPDRTGGPRDFFKDCPLTKIGLYQATLTGEAMKKSGIVFSHVFCSPSLRCIETCAAILKASGNYHTLINVEPGLFEWLAWYHDGMPKWMTLQEMKSFGFNICMDYKPVITVEELQGKLEPSEQYYMRSLCTTETILKKSAPTGKTILLVGHAATLDTCTRQLIGNPPRNGQDLQSLVYHIPYCSVAMAEEQDGKWKLAEPPFPSLMHSNNARFDWACLLS